MPTKTEIDAQIIRLCKQNRKVEAIKIFKDYSNLGLRECKDYVDALAAGKTTDYSFPVIQNLDDRLIQLYRQGKKLEAIKLYKDTTKCDLKTALEYVENLSQPAAHSQKGHSSDSQIADMMDVDKRSFFQKLIAFFTGDKA